jgi:transcriptional regulator with GAF, ATPase, and Fis domain
VAIAPVLLGISAAIRKVTAEAEHVARSNSKVLITGESGVGKEVLAGVIHARSRRSHVPLITINCAGLPETLLESELFGHVRGSFTDAHRDKRGFLEIADGGTILLDEVGEMSLRMQRMLLRFLENGEIHRVGSERPQTVVDVRIVAATNRDLLEQVERKEFRADLYYRLNIVHLVIPPLRERAEDVPLLLRYFLERLAREHNVDMPEISAEALAVLQEYQWPGNVRELRNVAERIVLTCAGRIVEVADVFLPRNEAARQQAPLPPANTPEAVANAARQRMAEGESFWTAVYEPFINRDITRETVRLIVKSGLERTNGSYRLVAELFNLPPQDYKRFMGCLQKYECHMPFQKFRVASARLDRDRTMPVRNAAAS